ncbi:hypothetical protein NQZ68_002372 [Dissostichus eleginoides]|nr:hypothetical protein NQZ68_002372 [Dissostichus eleginoides]
MVEGEKRERKQRDLHKTEGRGGRGAERGTGSQTGGGNKSKLFIFPPSLRLMTVRAATVYKDSSKQQRIARMERLSSTSRSRGEHVVFSGSRSPGKESTFPPTKPKQSDRCAPLRKRHDDTARAIFVYVVPTVNLQV